jgi:hypothetical protein
VSRSGILSEGSSFVAHDWLAFSVELLGILAVLAIAGAVGFSVVKSIDLVRGERELSRRLRSERLAYVNRLIEELSRGEAPPEEAIRMIEKYVEYMRPGWQREELTNALRQPLEGGRRAYAAKILRAASADRSAVASSR